MTGLGVIASIFTLVAGVIGLVFLTKTAWQAIFLVVGVLALVLAMTLLMLLEDRLPRRAQGAIALTMFAGTCFVGLVLASGDGSDEPTQASPATVTVMPTVNLLPSTDTSPLPDETNSAPPVDNGTASPAESQQQGATEVVKTGWQVRLPENNGVELDSQKVVAIRNYQGGDIIYLNGTFIGTFWEPVDESSLTYESCRTQEPGTRQRPVSDFAVGSILCAKSSGNLIAAIRIDAIPGNDVEPLELTISIWRP